MALHAFVLHLTRASARKANAHKLVETCSTLPGLDHAEIWPAVDGAKLSSSDLSDVVGADLFAPSYPFPLGAGEIGCFLSHRQIWAEIVRRDLTAGLIIEDDVRLDTKAFTTAFALAAPHASRLSYIKLRNTAPGGKTNLADTAQTTRLVVGEQPGLGMQAQVVSRGAAIHLLEQTEIFDRPVDTLLQSHWHTGLRLATAYPAGVHHCGHELEGSTVQSRKKKTLLERLSREVRRGFYRRHVRRLSKISDAPMPDFDA